MHFLTMASLLVFIEIKDPLLTSIFQAADIAKMSPRWKLSKDGLQPLYKLSSLHCIISLSFCLFSYNGVHFDKVSIAQWLAQQLATRMVLGSNPSKGENIYGMKRIKTVRKPPMETVHVLTRDGLLLTFSLIWAWDWKPPRRDSRRDPNLLIFGYFFNFLYYYPMKV